MRTHLYGNIIEFYRIFGKWGFWFSPNIFFLTHRTVLSPFTGFSAKLLRESQKSNKLKEKINNDNGSNAFFFEYFTLAMWITDSPALSSTSKVPKIYGDFCLFLAKLNPFAMYLKTFKSDKLIFTKHKFVELLKFNS